MEHRQIRRTAASLPSKPYIVGDSGDPENVEKFVLTEGGEQLAREVQIDPAADDAAEGVFAWMAAIEMIREKAGLATLDDALISLLELRDKGFLELHPGGIVAKLGDAVVGNVPLERILDEGFAL